MLYRSSSLVSAHRRGVVLLVVMALLALFAAVGLSFVFYADGEAFASKIGAQAIVKEMPEVDPEDLAAFFLNQMIYGTNNQYSALRSWDLARSMYGYNPYALNFTPYNGEGRASFAPATTNDPNLGIPMFNAINYQTFWSETQAANYNVVRTPEYYGSVRFPTKTGPTSPLTYQATGPTYRYVGGANAPWTAYDTNSLWLAQVAADGTVLMPSFGRPWLANAITPGLAAKYMSVFIDPIWNPGFYPLPDADQQVGKALPPQVKNLESGPGMLQPGGVQGAGPYFNNDSYWTDPGFPVMTAPNGKRYKALFAPLVMDLSNRLNFWANGNRVAGTAALPSNASNQGFGSSEVNLSRVLGAAIISATETGGKVKIMTASPHGLTAGQAVIINNVPVNGYNGVFAVTSVSPLTTPPAAPYWFTYTDTTKKLTSAVGTSTAPIGLALPVSELQNFLDFRYGGANGNANSAATGPASPPPTYAPIAITKAAWAKGTDLATISTAAAHGLGAGQRVLINGVANAQYNGLFNIAAVPSTNTFQYYYSPPNNGNLGASAGGTVTLVPNIRPGNFANYVNANASNSVTKLSSTPPLLPFTTATAQAVPAKGAHTVRFVPYVPGAATTPFPWALQAGMMVNVDSGANMESVLVTAANYAVTPPTFTATFKAKHAAGVPVTFSPYAGFPTFLPNAGFPAFVPAGWLNAPPGELANNPLLLNLLTPGGLNMPPLPMSHQEALLRYGGTNSPALTSDIFRRMPNTLSNPRSRMMGTLVSWDFDRITSAPYINVNTSTTPPYGLASGTYPLLGANEIQVVTVTGSAGETFTLTFGGQTTAKLRYNATAAQVQKALQALASVGAGNATVSGPTGAPPTLTYTVTFAGKLANVDVPNITGTGVGVTIKTVSKNGGPLFTAPNFGLAATVPTPNSDFYNLQNPDFRSALAQNLRVDLTRPLTDYPPPAATGLINTGSAQYARAVADRQQFARDIYNALVRATGARDPNSPLNAAMIATNPDYLAARWLAQLAVNIVDYIDNDDYMTPFVWNSRNPSEILFGTELPRLVLNEVYAQQEAGTAPANSAVGGLLTQTPGQVNVWAELYNPFNTFPKAMYPWSQTGTGGPPWSPLDTGAALLQLTAAPSVTPPYIIEIQASGSNLTAALTNSTTYNPNGDAPATPGPLSTQNYWGTTAVTQQVLPANGIQVGAAPTIIPIEPYPPSGKSKLIGASAKGLVVTIETAAPHKLTKANIGYPITITGVPVAGYNGTFNITGVPAANSFTYTALTAGLAQSGGGTAMYVNAAAGISGFYVVGPANAQYTAGRAPDLPATVISPSMSFAAPTVAITSITHAGNTVTVHFAGVLPASFTTGESIVISGVTAKPAAGAAVTASYNNSIAGNPATWTITATTANTLTFTYTGTAALPAAGVPAGTAATGGTVILSYAPNANGNISGITLLLRRLANPHLTATPDWNASTAYAAGQLAAINSIVYQAKRANTGQAPPNANWIVSNTPYNPYITVDYVDQLPVYTTAPAGNATLGRSQPYAASTALTPQTAAPTAPLLIAPQSTFFSQNYPNAPGPFDWLVHLDRPPVNVIELLHVSGFRPHELTQRFAINSPNGKATFGHYAPWNPFALNTSVTTSTLTMADPNAMIYRALDQFSTSYMAGTTPGGRRPGLVNLNTMTELEIFQALCDAHDNTPTQYPNPWFTQTDVQTILTKLATARGVPIGSAPTVEPTPFKSFSAASTVGNTVSYNDTWFRPDPTNAAGQPVFIPPSLGPPSSTAHPYWQSSLLQKIYNNVTTTSNVFAIWWTVGYFEVVDESVMPPRLGQEIGRSQNRHIRHRFFAIVDRSGLQLANSTAAKAVTLNTTLAVPQMTTMTITQPAAWSKTTNYALNALVSVTAKGGTTSYICIQPNINEAPATQPAYWQPLLQPGMLLEIDTGANAEVVTVLTTPAPANDTFTAYFTKSHLAGVPIVWRGNPGPRNPYNPRQDSNVVLHLSVIK